MKREPISVPEEVVKDFQENHPAAIWYDNLAKGVFAQAAAEEKAKLRYVPQEIVDEFQKHQGDTCLTVLEKMREKAKKPVTTFQCSPSCPVCQACRFNKIQKAIFFFIMLPAFIAVLYIAFREIFP